jgi:hypothetical protein
VPVDAQRPPYGAYAAIAGAFLSGLGGTALFARARDRDPSCYSVLDLATLGLATFKAARTISRDPVTSFARAPFVEGEPHHGEGEEPVRTGDLQQAVGELVTCTRCVGTWSALGVVGLRVLNPDAGRTLSYILASSAANDWMQAGFKLLTEQTNLVGSKLPPED